MKGVQFFEFLVDVLITLGCGSFVAWQGWKCLHKYIENRTLATIQMKNVLTNGEDNLYPAFTVCPISDSTELEDYFESVSYLTYSGEKYSVNTSALKSYYFRGFECYAIEEPMVATKNGLAEFEMKLTEKVLVATVFLHLPGSFFSKTKSIQTQLHYEQNVDYSYEILKAVSTEEELCIADPKYRPDDCLIQLAHEYSMDTFGCSFLNNDTECQNMDTLIESLVIYQNYTTSGHSIDCPKHCTDLIQDINLKPIRYHPTRNVSMLYINFPKYVKEITIRSDYESLELFAEIGGYVGLFMGVSIVQIKSILKFFISKVNLKNH